MDKRTKLAAGLLVALPALASAAGWNGTATVWPSQEHWNQGHLQDWETDAALNERLQAFTTSHGWGANRERLYGRFFTPGGGPFPFSNYDGAEFPSGEHENLWHAKRLIEAICYGFVNTNKLGGTNLIEYLDTYIGDPVTNVAGMLDLLWTPRTLAIDCGAPTNWYDAIPISGVKGLGPFTNDTTAPYAHGWTNYYTIKGGPLPTGRVRWYTTDYGKQHIPAMLNRLTVTVPGMTRGWDAGGATNYANGLGVALAATSTWACAAAQASNNVAVRENGNREPEQWMSGEVGGSPETIRANIRMVRNRFKILLGWRNAPTYFPRATNPPPQFSWAMYAFVTNELADFAGGLEVFDTGTTVFDNNTFGTMSNGAWFLMYQSAALNLDTNQFPGGYTNLYTAFYGPTASMWPNECAAPASTNDTAQGWSLFGMEWQSRFLPILSWINGFQYR